MKPSWLVDWEALPTFLEKGACWELSSGKGRGGVRASRALSIPEQGQHWGSHGRALGDSTGSFAPVKQEKSLGLAVV